MSDVSFDDDVGTTDHEALIAAGRDVEMIRRRTEGELVQVMVELERTKAYASRGYHDVAGWGVVASCGGSAPRRVRVAA